MGLQKESQAVGRVSVSSSWGERRGCIWCGGENGSVSCSNLQIYIMLSNSIMGNGKGGAWTGTNIFGRFRRPLTMITAHVFLTTLNDIIDNAEPCGTSLGCIRTHVGSIVSFINGITSLVANNYMIIWVELSIRTKNALVAQRCNLQANHQQ